MYLVLDTETTGLPISYNLSIDNLYGWPRLVQISWLFYNETGELKDKKNYIIKPIGYDIPYNSSKIHKITTKHAILFGNDINRILKIFKSIFDKSLFIVGHNIKFDINVINSEFMRKKSSINHNNKIFIDTQKISTNFCAIKINDSSKKFKWPTLLELYNKLFYNYKYFINNNILERLHNSEYDVLITSCCFFKLIYNDIITNKELGLYYVNIKNNINDIFFKKIYNYIINIHSRKNINKKQKVNNNIINKNCNKLYKNYFHIHNHTEYSILSSSIKIDKLISKAYKYNMSAIGITDINSMMGVYNFLEEIEIFNSKVEKKNHIKGIIGCELTLCNNDNYNENINNNIKFSQVFLAKNIYGYYNLSKLCSSGYIKKSNFFVTKKLIKKYHNNLIALTGNINSEIPYTILNNGKEKGEKLLLYWHNIFKDNLFIELFNHGIEEEKYLNSIMIELANKHKINYIPQNNNYYLNKLEYKIHDLLWHIKNKKIKNNTRNTYFKYFPTNNFYFKNKYKMYKIFNMYPECFKNLNILFKKIEKYKIDKHIILPKFKIDNKKYNNENEYLRYLVYKGYKKKYPIVKYNIIKRIKFELSVIFKLNFSGYFLIVYDFIKQAKNMNVYVGPGRGSVAGSVVAYCLNITNIDPIKYNLLFERFLNYERSNLPDIDIDFDDIGREKVINWVMNKYGKNKIAQIVTYSIMAAKSSIRDIIRVFNLPLSLANKISKIIPNNCSLHNLIYNNNKNINKNLINTFKNFLYNNKYIKEKIIDRALLLEGIIRNTGIHACGIIITPSNIINYIPIFTTKDSNLLITQFDNRVIEKIGLLKMDFLGLRTLTIIKDTLLYINKRYNFKLDINNISLKDIKTFNLFKNGETIGIFQYESIGMQKYLFQLQPNTFNELIALNALYRPGPIKYIPIYIKYKNNKNKIKYELPEMKDILKSTYGVIIYQEQVMLIAQKIASFSKIEADIFRRSISKKNTVELYKLKDIFIKKGLKNKHPIKKLEKIWNNLQSFASYAFNKSHATCYTYIAYQTAYLKSNFTTEYIVSLLNNNIKNTTNLSIFIKECNKLGIKILKPDINNSDYFFNIVEDRLISYGLGAIKGISKLAIEYIINNRNKYGKFKSIFNFIRRIDNNLVNKKVIELLIISNSFSCFKYKRDQYFINYNNNNLFEKLIEYSKAYSLLSKKLNNSLFKLNDNIYLPKPDIKNIPKCKDKLLYKEKEILGGYISYHPLDKYDKYNYMISNISWDIFMKNIYKYKNKIVFTYGIVTFVKKNILYNYNNNNFSKIFFILENKCYTIKLLTFDNYNNLLFNNNIIYINMKIVDIWKEIIKINIIKLSLLNKSLLNIK